MSNLFSAQQQIINRIKSETTGFITVANPSAIAGLTNLSGVLPACIVAPSIAPIDSEEMRGNKSVEEQRWDIVIIVAHQNGDCGTETLASNLISSVIKALSYFDLGAGFVRPMRYAGRPEKPAYDLAFVEFPLAFTVKKVVGL